MSSVIAHAMSASLIALTAVDINPGETGYLVAASAAGGLVDLDHVFYAIRDREMYRRLGFRGNLHNARSIFHELPGLVLLGAFAAALFLVNHTLAQVLFLAFAVHLVEDWIMGKSSPFVPIDKTIMQLFPFSFRQKVAVDIFIITVSGVLWLLYLSGRL